MLDQVDSLFEVGARSLVVDKLPQLLAVKEVKPVRGELLELHGLGTRQDLLKQRDDVSMISLVVDCVLQVAHDQRLETVLTLSNDRDYQLAVEPKIVVWLLLSKLMTEVV